MLFGSKEWLLWAGVSGFALFLLLGNLTDYVNLQSGVYKLLGLVSILLVFGAGILLIVARFKNPKAKKSDYIWALIPVGVIAVLLILIVVLGLI